MIRNKVISKKIPERDPRAIINYEIDKFRQDHGMKYENITTYGVLAIKLGGDAERDIVHTLIRSYNRGIAPEDAFSYSARVDGVDILKVIPGLSLTKAVKIYEQIKADCFNDLNSIRLDINFSAPSFRLDLPEGIDKGMTLPILMALKDSQDKKRCYEGKSQYDNRRKILKLLLLIYKGSIAVRGESYLSPLEYNYRVVMDKMKRISEFVNDENVMILLQMEGIEQLKTVESMGIEQAKMGLQIHDAKMMRHHRAKALARVRIECQSIAKKQQKIDANNLFRAYNFLQRLGVSEGSKILTVGMHTEFHLPIAANILLEADLAGYEKNESYYKILDYNLRPYYAENMLIHNGSFSSGQNSISQKLVTHSGLEDDSQNFVMIMAGAVSDDKFNREANSIEILKEAIRVLKSGGTLVVGSQGKWNVKNGEQKVFESNLKKLLKEEGFTDVKLGKSDSQVWQYEGKSRIFTGDSYIIVKDDE